MAGAVTSPSSYSPACPLRAFALLYLSSFLSLGVFVCALVESGDASLGLNLITPVFALLHHVLALAFLHWWRRRPSHFGRTPGGGGDRRPPLVKEHSAALRPLAVMYTLSTLAVLAVSFVYRGEMHGVECKKMPVVGGRWARLTGGVWVECDDPRNMIWVVLQGVFGVLETVTVWLLWREFARRTSSGAPTEAWEEEEEEEWNDMLKTPLSPTSSVTSEEFSRNRGSLERRPHYPHEHVADAV